MWPSSTIEMPPVGERSWRKRHAPSASKPLISRVWAPTVTGTRAVRPAARIVRIVAPSPIGSIRRPVPDGVIATTPWSYSSCRSCGSIEAAKPSRSRPFTRSVATLEVGSAKLSRSALGSSSTGAPSTCTLVRTSAAPARARTSTEPDSGAFSVPPSTFHVTSAATGVS